MPPLEPDLPIAPTHPPRYWPTWLMLSLFIFVAFECALLAVSLKGSWFILLAPAAVCGVKAWDAWQTLKRAAGEG